MFKNLADMQAGAAASWYCEMLIVEFARCRKAKRLDDEIARARAQCRGMYDPDGREAGQAAGLQWKGVWRSIKRHFLRHQCTKTCIQACQ